MRQCPNCGEAVPNTAKKCALCDAVQPQPQKENREKTMMGYAAADLIKRQPPAANSDDIALDKTMLPSMVSEPAGNAGGGFAATGTQGEVDGTAATMLGENASISFPEKIDLVPLAPVPSEFSDAPQPEPAPPQVSPRAPMIQGTPVREPVVPTPASPMQRQESPALENKQQSPPYLASQTAARAYQPIEPWLESFPIVAIVAGILLAGVFVCPWEIRETMVFAFSDLFKRPVEEKLLLLGIPASAFLALVVGNLRIGAALKGALLGGVGLALYLFSLHAADYWTVTRFVAFPILAIGLLLRSQYQQAWIGRGMILAGAAFILALFLIPENGTIPVVGLFESIVSAERLEQKALIAIRLLPVLFAVLSLLFVVLPSQRTGGATIFAWIWILFPVLLVSREWIVNSSWALESAGVSLMAVAQTAWLMLLAYGAASAIGKILEPKNAI